ncbi:hypothetical protein [Lusitaniella coriacea]|uniref:hypothetical protein n=1 Tax=Lusitaniella coriacea TaxID=1983105 RepID=UPI003CEE0F8C
MYSPVFFSQPLTVEQVVHQILAFGRISQMDRDLLHSVMQKRITEKERQLVSGLQKALHRGQLSVA